MATFASAGVSDREGEVPADEHWTGERT
jgi:hypothetical protein